MADMVYRQLNGGTQQADHTATVDSYEIKNMNMNVQQYLTFSLCLQSVCIEITTSLYSTGMMQMNDQIPLLLFQAYFQYMMAKLNQGTSLSASNLLHQRYRSSITLKVYQRIPNSILYI